MLITWTALEFRTKVHHMTSSGSEKTRERLEDACSMCIFNKKLLSYMVLVLSHFSCVWLFATPWVVDCQVPLSMGFSRQEHWSGMLRPISEDLPYLGNDPISLTSPGSPGGFFTSSITYTCICNTLYYIYDILCVNIHLIYISIRKNRQHNINVQ